MSEFLDQQILRRIYSILLHNPGIHLSKIAELANVNISEVERYLLYLENKGIIGCTKEEGYVRYHLEERRINPRDKRRMERKKRLYDLIMQNPGLHLTKIAELLGMSLPLAEYHLRQMERNKEITWVKDTKGYYKTYYTVTGGIKNQDTKILEALRRKTPLKIVLYLIKQPNLKHKDFLDRLGVSSSTLSYHLTELVKNDIVDVQPYGKEKGYTLKNREEIIRIIQKYNLHVELHLALEGIKEMWDDLNLFDFSK
ncbi:MAG: winged helix-turn-helix transcriptional regulator [Euryarchaeota archaeon]|nr:winged helix-turn-helix transcriptional regulator [Euryarchaeota archaeon]